MVTSPLLIFKGDFSTMVPDTANVMMRGPFALIASLKLPVPLSSRFCTIITFPPLPPVVNFPNPSAPGKANGCACIENEKVAKQKINPTIRYLYICVMFDRHAHSYPIFPIVYYEK